MFQVNSSVHEYTITEIIMADTNYTISVRARTDNLEWGPPITKTVTTRATSELIYNNCIY